MTRRPVPLLPTTRLRAVACLTAPVGPVGWDAWRIRDAVAAGGLRPRDVVQAHLDRLDEIQPYLNAAVEICREAALADADRLQAQLDAGEAAGPLCGVPFTVKDVIATAGVPTRCGSGAFADNVPTVDAVAVQRLRAAGAVLIAKTNCPEFAFGVTTENEAFGRTRSPWGTHSPGGSSGGDAALVSASASAFGIGTDYGGSLRWPAQCCGVLALRPELGVVDGAGQLPERGGLMDGRTDPTGAESVQRHFQVVGPIARSVRDTKIVFDVISGATTNALLPNVGGRAGAIGWIEAEDSERVGSEVRHALHGLLAQLQGHGLIVEHRSGLFDGLHETFNALRATDAMTDLRSAVGARRDRVGLEALRSLDAAPASHADPLPLWDDLDQRRRVVWEALDHTPVLIFPVAPVSACRYDGIADVDGEAVAGFRLMAQCRAVTALGLPSLSIPIGFDHGRLPISVQVIAAAGREDLVLYYGAIIEMLTGGAPSPPWLTDRPTDRLTDRPTDRLPDE